MKAKGWLSLRSFMNILESTAWCSEYFLMSDAWEGQVKASDVSVKTATVVCYDRSRVKCAG